MKRSQKSLTSTWLDLARDSMELMQGSATVIAKRTSAITNAVGHPTAAHDREMKRMVEEKVEASAASLTSMAFSAAASCQSMYFATLFGGRVPSSVQAQRAVTKVLQAGMAPYQKTVRSNVKRLRK